MALLAGGLLILCMAACESGTPALSTQTPIHLEEQLDIASIHGSEIPQDIPVAVEWNFEEGPGDWKPAAAFTAASAIGIATNIFYEILNGNDPREQELYRWLAQWERGHLKFLAEINAELLEEVWHESSFWPF